MQYLLIIHGLFCGPLISGHMVLNDFVDLSICASGIVEYNKYSHFASVFDVLYDN
jgi:hypothetical protein